MTASAHGYISSTKKAKVEDAPATQINFVLKKVTTHQRKAHQYDQMQHAGDKPGTGVIPGPLFGAGFPGKGIPPSVGGMVGGQTTNGITNQGAGNLGWGNYGNPPIAGAGDGAVPSQTLQDGPTGMSDEMSNPVGHLEDGLDSSPNVGIFPGARVEDGVMSNYQSDSTLPKLNSVTGIDATGSDSLERFTGNTNQARPAIQGESLDSIAMSSPYESNARDYLDGQLYSDRNTQFGMQ